MQHNIKGLKIFDSGKQDNRVLLFVHAFPLSHRMWDGQAEYFKNDYRVITYDTRGFGESREGSGYYTIDSHADDLFSIIDELKLEKPVATGLSMGGYILLRAAEREQDRFKVLIFCDTRAEADSNEGKLNRAKQIKQIGSGGRKDFLNMFAEILLGESTKKDTAKAQVMKIIRAIMDEQNSSALEAGLLAMASRTDTTAFLEKIHVPSLIIVGEEDKLTPPELSASMNKNINKSILAVIPKAGHLSNIENPQAFNRSIEDFIKNL